MPGSCRNLCAVTSSCTAFSATDDGQGSYICYYTSNPSPRDVTVADDATMTFILEGLCFLFFCLFYLIL